MLYVICMSLVLFLALKRNPLFSLVLQSIYPIQPGALEKNRESKVQGGGNRRPDDGPTGQQQQQQRGRRCGRGGRRRERRRWGWRRPFPPKATTAQPRRGGDPGAVTDRHLDVVDTGVREGCSHVGRGEDRERSGGAASAKCRKKHV